MTGDDVRRQLRQHAPLTGVALVHHFIGLLEDTTIEISVEVREWEEDGKRRYHIRATSEEGKVAFGTNPYDDLTLAIATFHWAELYPDDYYQGTEG